MTREGYDALTAELDELITVKRKENAERLKEAISYGDLSENSEYIAAKDDQAETEDRIHEIEQMLRTAKVVDEESTVDEGTVQTGRTVRVKDLVYDEEVTYKIVGNTEADPFKGKLSNVSLVGQHLIGTKVGDVIEFPVPDGTAKYEILEIVK
jgi:transcription elongation factor GreA